MILIKFLTSSGKILEKKSINKNNNISSESNKEELKNCFYENNKKIQVQKIKNHINSEKNDIKLTDDIQKNLNTIQSKIIAEIIMDYYLKHESNKFYNIRSEDYFFKLLYGNSYILLHSNDTKDLYKNALQELEKDLYTKWDIKFQDKNKISNDQLKKIIEGQYKNQYLKASITRDNSEKQNQQKLIWLFLSKKIDNNENYLSKNHILYTSEINNEDVDKEIEVEKNLNKVDNKNDFYIKRKDLEEFEENFVLDKFKDRLHIQKNTNNINNMNNINKTSLFNNDENKQIKDQKQNTKIMDTKDVIILAGSGLLCTNLINNNNNKEKNININNHKTNNEKTNNNNKNIDQVIEETIQNNNNVIEKTKSKKDIKKNK